MDFYRVRCCIIVTDKRTSSPLMMEYCGKLTCRRTQLLHDFEASGSRVTVCSPCMCCDVCSKTCTCEFCTGSPYPHEKPPMGGTPYIGFRPGGGPTFAVSLSHLSAERSPR